MNHQSEVLYLARQPAAAAVECCHDMILQLSATAGEARTGIDLNEVNVLRRLRCCCCYSVWAMVDVVYFIQQFMLHCSRTF